MERGAYRGDVDGLRAVAILPVLFFHAAIWPFASGYVGVDIFFVISGYLITGLILRQTAEGRFSLPDFYERRIRRILPALAVMMLAVAVAACLLLLPDELKLFGGYLAASALFGANLLYLQQGRGYFGPTPNQNPLLHVWSLSVEEQFYLFWPLVVMVLARRRALLAPAIAALGLLSLAAALLFLPRHPMVSFFLLPTRAWELLLGAFLAAAVAPLRSPRLAGAMALTGMTLILFALVQQQAFFPAWSCVCAALGAALLLQSGTCANPVSAALGTAVPRFIGKISYSLYLWHWPLLVFGRLYLTREPDLRERLMLLAAAVVLALVSWLAVEGPLRRGASVARRGPIVFMAAIAVSVSFLGLGLVLWHSQGLQGRTSERVRELEAQAGLDISHPCLKPHENLAAPQCRLTGSPADRQMVVWGDSFADALAPGLTGVAADRHLALQEMARPFCLPLPGQSILDALRRLDTACERHNRQVQAHLRSSRNVELVVLHAAWESYLPGHVLDAQGRPMDERAARVAFANALEALVQELDGRGVRVLLIGAIPRFPRYPMHCVGRSWILGRDASDCTVVPAARAASVDNILAGISARHPSIRVFFPAATLCDARFCHAMINGQLMMRDTVHLSPGGAALVGGALRRQIRDWDPAQAAR